MADAVAREVAELRQSVDRLTQGLQLMLETQATHSEMLGKLLVAATQPTPQETELGAVLARIAALLGDQTRQLEAVRTILKALPADVGTAVAASVRDGLARL
jgi:ABC-type transporter Mla subunit MlaD